MQLSDDSQMSYSQAPTKNEQEKYKKIRVLGEGSMGKVYLVECNEQNQKLYVMKRINIGHLEPKQKQQALLEAQLHKMVRHQNIIEFKEIYHTTKDKLCIIMEYAEGGDLDELLKELKQNKKTLSEEEILKNLTQICLALKEIHDKKIVHRDLKGANIFLTKDGKIKVGDFGISKAMDKTVLASKSFVGTPFYLSPQMVQGKPYSTKADIWALGVILYHMTAIRLPFDANSLPVLALKILKGAYPQIPGNSYSKQLKNLISSMLQVDQRKRLSVNEILGKPILSKYLPKQFVITFTPKIQAKVQLRVQKIKLATTRSKKQLKVETEKLSEQEKKKRREQEKIKREQERKKMRQDIKNKRIGSTKDNQQLQVQSRTLQVITTQSFQGPKKNPPKAASKPITSNKNIKQQLPKSPAKQIQKPWKNKNLPRQKKQPQIQILLPGQRQKLSPQVVKPLKKGQDFDFKIFVHGQNPYRNEKNPNQIISSFNNSDLSQKQQQNLLSANESSHDFSNQIEEIMQNQSYNENNMQQLLANVQKAQFMVGNLNNPYQKNEIELYEESADFDHTMNFPEFSKAAGKNSKKFENNESDMENMKFITNITDTENLQELRQILQDRLGDDGFISALSIVKEHFQTNGKKDNEDNDTQDSQAYLFNRKVLRQKLNFLTQEQFERNIELLYTISVMEDLQMMKNFQDDSEDIEDQSYDQDNHFE